MLDYHKTADEIPESVDTALLPVGSVEQHGSHLPIGTDYIITDAIAKGIGRQINCLLFPTIPFSTCYEHRGKRGSVWVKPDTFYYFLKDIVNSLIEQGFKKIIILIGHGGVFIAGPAIRELNKQNPNISVIRVDLVQFLGSAGMREILECKDNLHAGEFETSLMLFINKNLVKMENACDFIPDVPRDFLNYAPIFKYCPGGVWGKPSLASREKGERIFTFLVEESVNYIKKAFRTLEEST